MNFWCSQISEPWSWTWRAYPGVWALVTIIGGSYLRAVAKHGDHGPEARRKRRFFLAGVLVLWVSSDWPIGLLGSSYLASVHMAQYMLYTVVIAPLLLLGTPEWMARGILDRLRLYSLAKTLSRPLFAGVTVNAILVATHAPPSTDFFRATQQGSFAMDMIWLVGGIILWQPIVSPMMEMRKAHPGVKLIYLFLASAVVPVLPASFLLFASFPLYSTYELAPRVLDWFSATDDQQVAGLFMKVGGIPVVWTTMAVIMFRWAQAEGVPGLDGSDPEAPPKVAQVSRVL